jgi:hypothetical protein
MLPSEHWIIATSAGNFRVDKDTAKEAHVWMKQWEGDPNAFNWGFDFTDLHGSECTVYCGALNAIYNSNAESRLAEREFNRELEEESNEF